MVLLDSLLLECESLVFKSLLSFEINFALGKLIHGLIIFTLEIFNFCEQILLLTLRVALLFVKSFVFVFDLMQQAFFLVFNRYYGSFSLRNFGSQLFDFLIEFSSFSCKFLWLTVILRASLFL